MADLHLRFEKNVSGKYYIDTSCICCGICVYEAPGNISIDEKRESGYISKQPENGQEEKVILNAIRNCPVEAIGADGEKAVGL